MFNSLALVLFCSEEREGGKGEGGGGMLIQTETDDSLFVGWLVA